MWQRVAGSWLAIVAGLTATCGRMMVAIGDVVVAA